MQSVVWRLLAERLLPPPKPVTERERVTEALRKAGLLVEISSEEKARAKQCTITLEEVRTAFDNSSGPPLSELIIEMRGPRG